MATSFLPNVTPVIVTPAIQWRQNDEREALVLKIRRSLARWEQAQESGNVDRYIALYATDFEYRGLSRSEWAALRSEALASHATRAIEIDELLLLADPVEEGLYLSRFRHAVTTDNHTTVTTKRLYWKQQDDGSLQIVAEDNG